MFSDDSARVGTYDTFYGYGRVGTESWYAGAVSVGTVRWVRWVRYGGYGGYDGAGKPMEPMRAQQEQDDADRLRKQVVEFAGDTGLASYAEGGKAAWSQAMLAPQTWADEVAVASCAAFLRRCIMVLAWNPEKQMLYAEKYLEVCESVTNKVIPIFYNGRNHYELLDEVWLQAGLETSNAICCS